LEFLGLSREAGRYGPKGWKSSFLRSLSPLFFFQNRPFFCAHKGAMIYLVGQEKPPWWKSCFSVPRAVSGFILSAFIGLLISSPPPLFFELGTPKIPIAALKGPVPFSWMHLKKKRPSFLVLFFFLGIVIRRIFTGREIPNGYVLETEGPAGVKVLSPFYQLRGKWLSASFFPGRRMGKVPGTKTACSATRKKHVPFFPLFFFRSWPAFLRYAALGVVLFFC